MYEDSILSGSDALNSAGLLCDVSVCIRVRERKRESVCDREGEDQEPKKKDQLRNILE